jgi:hypothetical protein
MLSGFRAKLREPYPTDFTLGTVVKYALVSGLFVYLFMRVFQPFGLSMLRPGTRGLLFAGYGLITGIMVLVWNFVVPGLLRPWFRDDRWNTGRHIAWAVVVTLAVGLACFVFTQRVYAGIGLPVRFVHFVLVMGGALVIGGLLVAGITLVNLNVLLRRSARLAAEANTRIGTAAPRSSPVPAAAVPRLTLISDNGKDRVEADLAEMLFLASEENYVAVHLQKGRLVRILLRGSLSRMEDELGGRFPQLFRCHRAYLVNLAKVQKVAGNAQGLRLTLPDVPEPIPVARRYVSEFRKKFVIGRSSPVSSVTRHP